MVQTPWLVKLFLQILYRYYTFYRCFHFDMPFPFGVICADRPWQTNQTKWKPNIWLKLINSRDIRKILLLLLLLLFNFTFYEGLIFYKFNIAIGTELAYFGQNSFNDLLFFFFICSQPEFSYYKLEYYGVQFTYYFWYNGKDSSSTYIVFPP